MVSLQFRAPIIIWEGFPFLLLRSGGVLAYTDWDQAKINLKAKKKSSLQGDRTEYRTGNREKLNNTQGEPGQAITSAVAYFPSISCASSCPVAL